VVQPRGDEVVSVISSSVFYDGFNDSPRLAHPEGVAVHRDGSVWCGSENGQVFRIAPDGSRIKVVADLGGFLLGMAFDDEGLLYVCQMSEATVYRVDPESGAVHRMFESHTGPTLPNHLVVDSVRRRLLVSDSSRLDHAKPAIWEISLDTGQAAPWLRDPLDFANGLAMSSDGQALLIAVSWEKAVRKVEIKPDGAAGRVSVACADLPGIPDGLAVIDPNSFIVSLYEPSELISVNGEGKWESLIHDETAHIMCHPTNIAFRGKDLFTANLGRWHITKLVTDVIGPQSSFPSDLARLGDD
jgi:sugar lactone lactonase YvrE